MLSTNIERYQEELFPVMSVDDMLLSAQHGQSLADDLQNQNFMERGTAQTQRILEDFSQRIQESAQVIAMQADQINRLKASEEEKEQFWQREARERQNHVQLLQQQQTDTNVMHAENRELMQGHIMRLTAEKAALLQRVAELEQGQAASAGSIQQLTGEKNDLTQQLAALRASMRQEIAGLTNEKNATGRQVADLQAQNGVLNQTVRRKDEVIAGANRVAVENQRYIQDVERQMANLRKQLQGAQGTDQKRLELLNAANKSLGEKIKQNNDKDKRILALEKDNKTKGNTIKSHEKTIDDQKNIIADANARLKAANQKITEIGKAYVAENSAHIAAKTKLDVANKNLVALRATNARQAFISSGLTESLWIERKMGEIAKLKCDEHDARFVLANEVLVIKPDHAMALYYRGHAYYYEGLYDLSLQDFTSSYNLKRDYWPTLFLGNLNALHFKNIPQATKFYRECLVLQPSNVQNKVLLDRINQAKKA
jgi:predicted  nucleic acid-binding Zn-ribbon protein